MKKIYMDNNATTRMREEVLEAMKRNRAPEVTSDTGDEADQAQAAMDRDLQFELSDTERNMLDQSEGALRKRDKGTGGRGEQGRGGGAEAGLPRRCGE